MQAVDYYGQGPCYKCRGKARVRAVKHCILGEVYNICCTNPNCGNATSRNYVWRQNAVAAWNCKPTLCDLFVDRILNKIHSLIEKTSKKERDA